MNGKQDEIKADCFLQEARRRINALLVQNNRY